MSLSTDEILDCFTAESLVYIGFQKWKARNGYSEEEFLNNKSVTNPDHIKVIDAYYDFLRLLNGEPA